jgi:hypothetical protein
MILVPSVPMNEPVRVPDVETGPDARNVKTMRIFDGRLVRIAFQHHRVEDMLAVIDEMHAVFTY